MQPICKYANSWTVYVSCNAYVRNLRNIALSISIFIFRYVHTCSTYVHMYTMMEAGRGQQVIFYTQVLPGVFILLLALDTDNILLLLLT